MCQNGNIALVLFRDHLDAADAETMVIFVSLGCLGKAVGEVKLAQIVVFHMDDHHAKLGFDVQENDTPLLIGDLAKRLNGVFHCVAKEGEDIRGLHEGETFAVDDAVFA